MVKLVRPQTEFRGFSILPEVGLQNLLAAMKHALPAQSNLVGMAITNAAPSSSVRNNFPPLRAHISSF